MKVLYQHLMLQPILETDYSSALGTFVLYAVNQGVVAVMIQSSSPKVELAKAK